MKDKESPLKQDLGPKKYREHVEKINRDYDRFKAGKTDPKTGVYYREIGVKPPKKMGPTMGCYPCPSCESYFSIKRSTVLVHCANCHSLISIKLDKLTDEVEMEITKSGG